MSAIYLDITRANKKVFGAFTVRESCLMWFVKKFPTSVAAGIAEKYLLTLYIAYMF